MLGEEGVQTVRTHTNSSGAVVEETVRAFGYGKTLVPMTADDMAGLKYHTEKGISVLGFVPRVRVKRWWLSDSVHAVLPTPTHAALYSALFRALVELDHCAIVRHVARTDSAPRICVLYPNTASRAYLLMAALPFAQDLRVLDLPDLSHLVRSDAPCDDFVNALHMHTPIKNVFNPAYHHMWTCIAHRALHPHAPLPSAKPFAVQSLPSHISLDLPLSPVKKFKRTYLPPAPSDGGKADADTLISDMFDAPITSVGSTDPVADFLYLVCLF